MAKFRLGRHARGGNGGDRKGGKLHSKSPAAQSSPGDAATPSATCGSASVASGASRKRKLPAEQPNRKQPHRGEPKPPKPTPRGPPLKKPKQLPADQLSPKSLEKRHARDAEYARKAYKRRRDAALGEADAAGEEYKFSKTGRELPAGKSGKAEAMRKSRRVLKVVKAVQSAGNKAQRVAALRDAADHHELRQDVRDAKLVPPSDAEVALFHQEQQRKMLVRAQGDTQAGGRLSNDRASARETSLAFSAASPGDGKAPSRRQRAAALGVDASSLKLAEVKRAKLTAGDTSAMWSSIAARRGHTHITAELRRAILLWLLAHDHVKRSPIARDTLLVLNPETKQKERVEKLLLEAPVRELYNDLIVPGTGLAEARGEPTEEEPDGRILIGERSFRYLIPDQCRRMTDRHKQMCGCETCIVPAGLQSSLNAWRLKFKKSLENWAQEARGAQAKMRATRRFHSYKPPVHAKISNAISEIQCQPIDGCGFPHWDCVLRRCQNCPKYNIPVEERATGPNAPTISFHVYKTVTEHIRGKDRSRKYLTLMKDVPIGEFHAKYYLP
mmetsp:Transcript_51974/g.134798  ORF Transcript_51974/g.134798 Transcript_51974/m.134798 type:complete len:557 (-) Transcript_51974:13-1683(-)